MNKTNQILLISILLLGLLVLARFSFFLLRFALLLVFVLAIGIYFQQLWSARREKRGAKDATEKSVHEKLIYSEAQIKNIHEEKDRIEEEITNLQTRLSNGTNLNLNIRRESERLIQEFKQELNLRNTKLEFYKSCINKLNSLLQNYQLTQELEKKRASLKQLQENNVEDIADLEAFKTSIEFEARHLDTIDELSLRMLDSHSLQDAENLRLELEKITKELP